MIVDPGQGHVYLTDISNRDKPWDYHRSESVKVQHMFEGTDLSRYGERICECSRRLIFAMQATDQEDFRLRLKQAHFCKVRQCPICQWRRSKMWRARFLEAVPRLKDDYPTARYLFLTLTVRNCEIEQLRDTLSWMNKAWLRLTKRKEFQALGWVKSVEVTRNSNDNSAHPHLHVLLMVRSNYFSTGYISQARWRSLWQECLRADYLPVVNIKTIKNRPSKAPSIPGSDTIEYSDGLLYGILETLKYGVKVPDLVADQHWLLELTRQTHKTRSVAIGGVLRGYLREHDPEDLLTEDESIDSLVEDAPLLYFDWFTQIRRYVKVDPRLS